VREIAKGATSQTLYVVALDSASTTGGRKTGIAYNAAGLTAYYVRNRAAAVAITLATLASSSAAWSSGGWVEVDATNAPGLYRLDVPDAAFATGADSVVVVVRGAAGMVQVEEEVLLVAYNPQDATALGLSRLDAAISSRQATSDPWSTTVPGAYGAGTAGNKLGSLGGGAGANTVTVTVQNDATHPVAGASFWVTTDSGGTNTVASATTDTFGKVTVYLGTGTFYGWAAKAGETFINPLTMVVP